MQNVDMAYEYERLLLGKIAHLNCNTGKTGRIKGVPTPAEHQYAVAMLRYVCRTYLYNWSPQELKMYLDKKVIKMLCLQDIISRIQFPPEIRKNNCEYLAHLVYPKEVPFDEDEAMLDRFERVLSGEERKMPKNYFLGERGKVRLNKCTKAILEYEGPYSSLEEVYCLFSSPQIIDLLKKYTIYETYREFYDSPIELLWDALSDSQKDDILYQTYQLKYCLFATIKGREE